MNDMHLADRQYSFAAVDHARLRNELELHPAEVVSVAEARAAAIVDMFPEQAPATAAGTVAALAQAVNTLTAMVNELAVMVNRLTDDNEYLRRKVERLEVIKGS